jgi:hypothetical protein
LAQTRSEFTKTQQVLTTTTRMRALGSSRQ